MGPGQVVMRDPRIEVVDEMIAVPMRMHHVLLEPSELVPGRPEFRAMAERHVLRYLGEKPHRHVYEEIRHEPVKHQWQEQARRPDDNRDRAQEDPTAAAKGMDDAVDTPPRGSEERVCEQPGARHQRL